MLTINGVPNIPFHESIYAKKFSCLSLIFAFIIKYSLICYQKIQGVTTQIHIKLHFAIRTTLDALNLTVHQRSPGIVNLIRLKAESNRIILCITLGTRNNKFGRSIFPLFYFNGDRKPKLGFSVTKSCLHLQQGRTTLFFGRNAATLGLPSPPSTAQVCVLIEFWHA